jgi:transcriptional regulator with XRE-family HTH domain
MLSKFGQLVRALRLQRNMLLSDMAGRLGVSPSYLSAVDFGRRPVPDSWPTKIAEILELDNEEAVLLRNAALTSSTKSRGAITMALDDLTPMQQEVAIQFARKLRQLSEEELKSIQNHLVEEKVSEQNWKRGSP